MLRWIGLGLLLIVSATGFAAWTVWEALPNSGPEQIIVNDRVLGVRIDRGYAYILHSGADVVLIDAGADLEAKALLKELGQLGYQPKDVAAILLTHAHFDHWYGAMQFPQATIYLGDEDRYLLRGEDLPKAPLPYLASRFQQAPPYRPPNQPLLPGTLLTFGDLKIEVLALPGHTAGSLAFLMDNVLFSGDSLIQHGQDIGPPPWFFSDKPKDVPRSLLRLRNVAFGPVADGHYGVCLDGRSRYERWLAKQDK